MLPYQDTKVDEQKTIDAIRALLRQHRVAEFREVSNPENGEVEQFKFKIIDPNHGEIWIVLKPSIEVVVKELMEGGMGKAKFRYDHIGRKKFLRKQAYRIAWRVVHDSAKAILISARWGIFSIFNAFGMNVAYEDPRNGEVVTLGELIEKRIIPLPAYAKSPLLLGGG